MASVHDHVKLTDLPNELLLDILELSPDMPSLVNAAHAHPTLYYLVQRYQQILATQTLKRELPEAIYTHAHVAFQRSPISLGTPENLTENHITNVLGAITSFKDDSLPSLKSNIADAMQISQLHHKVADLTEVYLRECFECRNQHFAPLQLSLTKRNPSESERTRIQQGIYLFEIIRKACQEMYVDKGRGREYYIEFYEKLAVLHHSLTDHLLAPWEMHQVIAIQAFFRRALHGFERDETLSERVMPGLLNFGIPFLHKALHTTKNSERDGFLRPYEEEVLKKPIHALGMVLSRGTRGAWTRQQPRPHAIYKRFGTGDTSGIRMWENIEAKQVAITVDNALWNDMFDSDQSRLEGRLDLWSTALWDEERWEDILQTLSRPESDCWKDIQHHCEPMELGFYISRQVGQQVGQQNWMQNESVEG
ncbi:hypothetical protein QQZ08_000106 [Neonectria magnoliae]|uniref:F-box domain-containing protein n=1 Tax=Neonectria magnoliae TaxID=2732573 RepID=A0ABR1IJT7_9HYPO